MKSNQAFRLTNNGPALAILQRKPSALVDIKHCWIKRLSNRESYLGVHDSVSFGDLYSRRKKDSTTLFLAVEIG